MIFMFTIPETLAPVVLQNKARRIRALKIPGYEDIKAPVEDTGRTLFSLLKVALTRPWKILVDTISLLVAIYLSVVYALLYMLFTIYPIVFQQRRGWNSGVGQLPLLGVIIGSVVGGAIVFYNTMRDRRAIEAGHKQIPEDRLFIACIGGIMFAVSMFWFSWTAEYNSIHWIVPTIAGVFLSASILLIFVAFLNYLTDAYLMFAASALAANTVCRSACGAAAPLYTQYMFDALGVGGGGSLIGGIAVLLAPIPFVFIKYGGNIRRKSKFAPTEDGEPVSAPVEQDPGVKMESGSSGGSDEESTLTSRSSSGTIHDQMHSTTRTTKAPHTEAAVTEQDSYDNNADVDAGVGLDRVAKADDTREQGAGQVST